VKVRTRAGDRVSRERCRPEELNGEALLVAPEVATIAEKRGLAAHAMSRQRLAMAADLVRVAIGCSAVIWIVVDDGSTALKAVLVLPAALLGRVARVTPAFDLLFACALAAEVTATGLGAYDSISWGDKLSHLVLPLLSAPILYAALVRLGAVTERSDDPSASALVGAVVVTAACVLAVGALWELVEWAADSAFGTDFSQGYGDTLGDLLADAVAAIGGGALVALWLQASRGAGRP
jgi:hypothetical protein